MPAAGPVSRPPVTRARAVSEAIALADEEGLGAVSMRRLAARLGVVPMALYKHVAHKEDLLGGMVDALIDTYDEIDSGRGWQPPVRARILSARTVLLRHPWARRAIESRTTRTPAVLGHLDGLAGLLIGGGLSADLTHHALHALGHRVWGFSPEAFDDPQALPVPADDPVARRAVLEEVRRTYPFIAEIALAATGGDLDRVGGGCDEQREFEFALDLLLDAFAGLHASGWTPGKAD